MCGLNGALTVSEGLKDVSRADFLRLAFTHSSCRTFAPFSFDASERRRVPSGVSALPPSLGC